MLKWKLGEGTAVTMVGVSGGVISVLILIVVSWVVGGAVTNQYLNC